MIPPVANNFVAGETIESALERAAELESREITAILNRLGEHYDTAQPALEDTREYVELIGEIEKHGLDACISVKPSQLGLDVDEDLFAQNLDRVAAEAADNDVFLWIDMEDHTTTDATIDAYERLVDAHPGNVGVCLQANLRRTKSDLSRIGNCDGKIRLVKGAYDEPDGISYGVKQEIDDAYRELIRSALTTHTTGVAIGSHDESMVDLANQIASEHDTEHEVQMLMGVREEYQTELAGDRDVYQYVPYGDAWLSYFYRRLRERSENMEFAARAIYEQYL